MASWSQEKNRDGKVVSMLGTVMEKVKDKKKMT